MKKIKRFVMTTSLALILVVTSMFSAFAATGWVARDGNWYYYRADGTMAKDQWFQESGNLYWMEEDGTKAVSTWHKEGDQWYWLDANGVAVTGWKEIDGKWYYFYENHAMAADATIGSFTVDKDGVWVVD